MTNPETHPATANGADGAAPLRIAMIGLRGVPATYGGVERAVEELSAHLAGQGHQVTVYARTAYSDPAVRSHRGVEVIRLPQINTKHAEAASHSVIAILHALFSRRYDLIHLHATGPSALAPIVRAGRLPAVATIQGLDWQREKWGRGARLVLKLAARLAGGTPTRTIVVSRALEEHFRAEHGLETTYIPNGVEPEPATDGDESPVPGLEPGGYLLSLGRLVPEKHVHTLIEAYGQVDTDVPLVVAGPSSHSPGYVAELERLAAADPRVRMIGPQYEGAKRWLMSNALAFLQPSSIEGLPIALLEALAVGRFPIVSDIGPNLEPVTVDGERLGEVVPVDDRAALAAAIESALRRTDRQEVGERLAAHVRVAYDWKTIASATEDVYRDVAGPPAAPGKAGRAPVLRNAGLYAGGLALGAVNTVRHRMQGYVNPRPFSAEDVGATIDHAETVVDRWEADAGIDWRGLRVLECGPGSDMTTGAVIRARGAESYTAVDAFDNRGQASPALYAELEKRLGTTVEPEELTFVKATFPELPELQGEFDLVVSNATLEHIEEMPRLFATFGRLVAPGGRMVHHVDAQAHMRWFNVNDPLNILRYSDRAYDALLRFPGAPNRLRAEDYEEAAARSGWTVERVVPGITADASYLANTRVQPRFRDRRLELLAFTLVATRT